jgi:hypothetical protein
VRGFLFGRGVVGCPFAMVALLPSCEDMAMHCVDDVCFAQRTNDLYLGRRSEGNDCAGRRATAA